MESICKYCSNSFVPKRTDSLYCSHSCRQLAYVLRKASVNTINGLNAVTHTPETLVELQNKKEPSIKTGLTENYPSTEHAEDNESVNKLTDKEHEPSIKEHLPTVYSSMTTELSVKKEAELPVNADKKEIVPEIKAVNTIAKAKEEQEKYVEYSSPLINEIAELTEDRNNLHTLYSLLHNKPETSAYWVSIRYRCLVECLLTFSEMPFIDTDDLKEVCNAFTTLINSKYFNSLTSHYPYTKEIVWLRDTIKNLCLSADEEELSLRFKKDTKLRLIATRWEMANYVPKISFTQLNFTE